MDKTVIGITGTGSLIGQAIIKSLLHSQYRHQLTLVGFDYFEHTTGSYWVDKNRILPDCLKEDVSNEDWLANVIDYLNEEKIKLLFIGLDFELKLFAKHKQEIESNTQCRVVVSSEEVVRIADDKYATYEFLREKNLNYPKTSLPQDYEKSGIKFPCVVKPRYGWRSRDVYYIKNKQELEARIKNIKDPIIQECIGNRKDEYTCGVIYLDGLKEVIALKRDLKDGNTSTAAYSHKTPQSIYDYIKDVSDKLQPFGPCNFQLMLDDQGSPKIFEINARHSGTTFIRTLFGFYEVEYLLASFLNLKVKKFNLREGRVKRYFEEMFIETGGVG